MDQSNLQGNVYGEEDHRSLGAVVRPCSSNAMMSHPVSSLLVKTLLLL